MKQLFRTIVSGAFLLTSIIIFTSCEGTLDDIFGEWSRPTPAEMPPAQTISFAESEKWWGTKDGKFTLAVTNTGDGVVTYSSSNPSAASVDPTTGEVTPGTVTSTTDVIITATVADSKNATYPTKTAQYTLKVGKGYRYLTWDDTSKKLVYHFDYPAFTNDFIDSSTGAAEKLQSGGAVKFVKGHITISTDITIGNDLLLVLLDGAKLEINGQLKMYSIPTSPVLSISAQSEGDKKGELVVKSSNDAFYCGKGMNIYGGKITAENTGTSGNHGIGVVNSPLNIYGGDVTAKGGDSATSSGGIGIKGYSGILITGKAIVNATGGNSTSNDGGYGISGTVTVSGEAQVIAKGGSTDATDNLGGNGISYLTIEDNGYVKAQGGDTNYTGSNGSYGVLSLTYKGGTFEAYGGKDGSGTTYRYGIRNTLTNESSAPVTFETSSDGETWDGSYTLTNVSPGNSVTISSTSSLQKRGIRKL